MAVGTAPSVRCYLGYFPKHRSMPPMLFRRCLSSKCQVIPTDGPATRYASSMFRAITIALSIILANGLSACSGGDDDFSEETLQILESNCVTICNRKTAECPPGCNASQCGDDVFVASETRCVQEYLDAQSCENELPDLCQTDTCGLEGSRYRACVRDYCVAHPDVYYCRGFGF